MDLGGISDATDGYALYGDLAGWWPLISPTEEYEEEAAFAADVLATGSGPLNHVLELGSGGGSNAVHLKDRFTMTLVDLSEPMLEMSRQINGECEHLQGDMRTLRLGREFDAVFVHDAIDYMITESELRQAVDTAFIHCRPGGVAVFVPDHINETFEPSTEHGGSDGDSGRGARYLGWTWDPEPSDTWVQTDYVFLLRESDASVRVVHESHRGGIFSRYTWSQVLADAGFEPTSLVELTDDHRVPREFFVGRRP